MLLRPCVGLVCFCYVGVGVGLCRSGLCRSGLFLFVFVMGWFSSFISVVPQSLVALFFCIKVLFAELFFKRCFLKYNFLFEINSYRKMNTITTVSETTWLT